MIRRLAVIAVLGLAAGSASAQISPGELSQAHARLEGSTHCLECHESRHSVSATKCLACHTALAARVRAGRGLHAQSEYGPCETCHVEHQGRGVDLVWWGKAGRAAFSHAQTGYALEGRHARLTCEACHQAKLVRDREGLTSGAASARTFLGLGTGCTDCHADIHRGQLLDCRQCHSFEAWKPAAGFDHAKTRYPLNGRHVAVGCDKCHAMPAAGPGARRYRGLEFGQCTACHQDVHRGRLGAACNTCHTTAAWGGVPRTSFDHDRTAYPLRGRHRDVACDRCHLPGKPLAISHGRCNDCHADAHRGELAQRGDRGLLCDACHDLEGFRPARFAADEHQRTRYPLAGAHLAVACDACHRRAPGQKTAVYRLTFARCTDCHADPHQGEVAKLVQKSGCESCHRLESWRKVSFDHDTTRFALVGGHAGRTCGDCHRPLSPGAPRVRMRFTNLPLVCTGCHRDVHEGQFATAATTACERCHDPGAWKPARFDHNRDSRYHLDGAHARVACAACHPLETREGRTFVRYKPRGSECRDCHAPGVKP